MSKELSRRDFLRNCGVSAAGIGLSPIFSLIPESAHIVETENFPGYVAYVLRQRDFGANPKDSTTQDVQLFIAHADGTEPKLITSGFSLNTLRWSPSGTKLAFLDYDPLSRSKKYNNTKEAGSITDTDFIRVYDMASQEMTIHPSGRNSVYHSFQWSPDESKVLYVADDFFENEEITAWLAFDIQKETETVVLHLPNDEVVTNSPTLSPDGSKVVLSYHEYGSLAAIIILDLMQRDQYNRYRSTEIHWPLDGHGRTVRHDPPLHFQWLPDSTGFTFFVEAIDESNTGTYYYESHSGKLKKIADRNFNLSMHGQLLVSSMTINIQGLMTYDILNRVTGEVQIVIPDLHGGEISSSYPARCPQWLANDSRLSYVNKEWHYTGKEPQVYESDHVFYTFNPDGSDVVKAPELVIADNVFSAGSQYPPY